MSHKRLFLALFLLIFSLPLFASNYDVLTTLRVISSEHFDVIYPKADEKYANLLSKYAEENLITLNEFFGTNWQPNGFPIVVTGDISKLNAYYSSLSASHIVMYNTIEAEGELEHFENGIKSVLLHEMGHAFILNNLSGGKRFFQKLFGTSLNNTLYLNMFVVEGLSVALESYGSVGRLNDPFVMQKFQMAALSGEGYNYRQLSGGADSYPAGVSSYIYGGAFFNWLIYKYGVEKFHTLISKMSSYFSFPELIKDVYGRKLDGLYVRFLASFEDVDAKKTEPVIDYSSRFPALFANENSVFFYDNTTSRLMRIDAQSGGAECVLTIGGLVKAAVSSNESYLAVVNYDADYPVLRLYERALGKYFLKYRIDGVYDMSFVNSNYGYKLALYRYDRTGACKYIELVDLLSKERLDILNLGSDSAYSLSEADKGALAFIKRTGLDYNLCLWLTDTNRVKVVDNPEDFVLKYMSSIVQDGVQKLALAYAIKDHFIQSKNYSRLMVYFTDSYESIKRERYTDNLEGGVKFPSLFDEKLVYVADCYQTDSIRYIKFDDMSAPEITNALARDLPKTDFEYICTQHSIDDLKMSRKYSYFLNSLPFVDGHLLLPSAQYDTDGSFGFGLQNISVDFSEQMYSYMNIMNYFGPKARVEFDYRFAFLTKKIKAAFTLSPQFKFDKSVAQANYFDFSIDFALDYNNPINSNKNFSFQLLLKYDTPVAKSSVYASDGLSSSVDFIYKYMQKRGVGISEYSGFMTEFFVSISDSNSYKKRDDVIIFNPRVCFAIRGFLPNLLPLRNTRFFTFNIPTNITLSAEYLYNQETANTTLDVHNVKSKLSLSSVLFAAQLVESGVDSVILPKTFILKFSPSIAYLKTIIDNQKVDGFVSNFTFSMSITANPTILGEYITVNEFTIGVDLNFGQKKPNSAFEFTPALVFNVSYM